MTDYRIRVPRVPEIRLLDWFIAATRTRNPALFFVHFFQIHSTVRQIRPLVNIVYPDIPDDAFLINKN